MGKWNNANIRVEFKKDQVFEECDFGAYNVGKGALWVNPYYRWESKTNFSSNNLRVGGVFRYNELFWRAQLRLNNLLEGEKTVGSVCLDQRGHWFRNNMQLRWWAAVNLCSQAVESWKLLAGYQQDRFNLLANAAWTAGDKGGLEVSKYAVYKHNNQLTAGVKYTRKVDSKDMSQ